MFSLGLMEMVIAGQQDDRLHNAERARLFKTSKTTGSTRLKRAVVVSGAVLVALMVAQVFAV